MKLQFRHQKFQADAAKAVCDVFAGQPCLSSSYMIDQGIQSGMFQSLDLEFTGFGNARIVPGLNENIILDNIRKIQRAFQIKPSDQLEGKYNLTIEMETGVGKTYTYIKTMYELNQKYGWSKFIVVVPSVAIREGVYKSFQITEDHFAEEYGKKIRYFIYNSSQLTEIDRFASDPAINVMIINSQAFNARGKEARRISMRLDEFRSRKPIDILAKTNPILIIDEPQSVEGAATKERLVEFNPLFTLRYSATHKEKYNMIYRLDAMEAYNKKLVKKIAVKGIAQSGTTANEGYVYLESVNTSKVNPTATIEFDAASTTGIRKARRIVDERFNLYDYSGGLEEYKNGYIISRIDGRDNSIEFLNGKRLYVGDAVGKVSEDQMRRIQIRETILSHLERERQLYYKGIKVLSLFFIDEVKKYRQYDSAGKAYNGEYADIFEQEYENCLEHYKNELGDEEYYKYLKSLPASKTHDGYFSIDKRTNRIMDSTLGDKRERTSDDSDAYDLIMKNKERLLDRKEPVRFIFSHSALREGWDNPNVFQICTLKQSSSDVRKRQEVGRGLRLSVNQDGERMDVNVLGEDVHNINVLTVIASESYDSFAKGLQEELAEAVADRPIKVDASLFEGRLIKDSTQEDYLIDREMAINIHESLIENGYVKSGVLTDKYFEDKKNNNIQLSDETITYSEGIIEILDLVYNPKALAPENARKNNVELSVDKEKLNSKEFISLWSKINAKSVYTVQFDEAQLINKSINAINDKLHVTKIRITVDYASMDEIKSKEQLETGEAFNKRGDTKTYTLSATAAASIKYDLVGKIVEGTGLTRLAIVKILQGIKETVFNQFKENPEEFIIKVSNLINEQKATVIIEHITYNKLDESYDTAIFTEPTMKGQFGVNAVPAHKHLYDHVLYDSTNEKNFAEKIDSSAEVAVYVKLPSGFYINTPVGKYNPDWAISFHDENVKHIYFIAETKGSLSSLQLREIEESKIHCAREHFKAISSDSVVYDVVNSFEDLLDRVMK
jgi:type III restriction enzyme